MATLHIRDLKDSVKARLKVRAARNGRSISAFDAQTAAIALAADASLATRNVKDFQGCGLKLIDPWKAKD